MHRFNFLNWSSYPSVLWLDIGLLASDFLFLWICSTTDTHTAVSLDVAAWLSCYCGVCGWLLLLSISGCCDFIFLSFTLDRFSCMCVPFLRFTYHKISGVSVRLTGIHMHMCAQAHFDMILLFFSVRFCWFLSISLFLSPLLVLWATGSKAHIYDKCHVLLLFIFYTVYIVYTQPP